jgi:cyclophilin family peptidyl-prolyl cis-trans isomerase
MFCRALLCSLVLIASAAVPSSEVAEATILRLEIEGKGTLAIQMHTREAPLTTARILELAGQGFYNGQRFFKVVRSPRPFLAQIGDPNSRTRPIDDPTLGTGGTGRRIPFESTPFRHVTGAVGLARLPDDPNSGDSQFYIMLGPASFLDGNYTVFGQVVSGLELLNRLEVGDRVTAATIQRGATAR